MLWILCYLHVYTGNLWVKRATWHRAVWRSSSSLKNAKTCTAKHPYNVVLYYGITVLRYTEKPLNTGHPRVSEASSVVRTSWCPLFRGFRSYRKFCSRFPAKNPLPGGIIRWGSSHCIIAYYTYRNIISLSIL